MCFCMFVRWMGNEFLKVYHLVTSLSLSDLITSSESEASEAEDEWSN